MTPARLAALALAALLALPAACGGDDAASADAGTASPDAIGPTPDAAPDAAPEDAAPEDAPDAGPALLAVPFAPAAPAEPYVDRPFLQEHNHTTPEVDPALAGLVSVVLPPPSHAAFDVPTQVTPRAVARHAAGGALELLPIPADDPDLLAAAAGGGALVLAGPSRLYRATPAGALEPVAVPDGVTVTGLAGGPGATWVLTDAGVGWLAADGPLAHAPLDPPPTAALEAHGRLYLAGDGWLAAHPRPQDTDTPDALPPAAWTLTAADGLAAGAIRAMVADVTLPAPLALVLAGDGGLQGLTLPDPASPILADVPAFAPDRVPLAAPRAAARTSDGGFVLATAGGACRVMDRGDGVEWRVYPAERWLPSEDVRAVATDPALPDGPLWLATAAGLATVTASRVTLEEKLAPFVTRVVERHDRDGAVADSHLTVRGDLSSNIPWDSDNDGGWTSYWLLAECYRWKVTADPAARAHFDRSLDAMLRLRDLTGTDHFVARAVIRKEGCPLDDCDDPDDGEWFTSPDGAWWVKGDTSNDEVISHLFMMGPAYALCADEAQRARIVDHVRGIVGGIMDHGWQLVDLDGEVTSYGQFDPYYCNDFPGGKVADGGRRSLAMLAGLTLAWHVTGDPRFLEGKALLMEEHHYDENAIHESEYPFRQGRYSGDGDELATQSWITLLLFEEDPGLRARWMDGWSRTYGNTRLQQGAWWDLANAMVGGEPEPGFAHGARWLRLAPVDMIRWNIHSSHRQDLAPPPAFYDQEGRMRSDGRIVPYDERACERWNTDQYRMDRGMDGWIEMDGADVLAPYWMARYYGLIVPAAGRP